MRARPLALLAALAAGPTAADDVLRIRLEVEPAAAARLAAMQEWLEVGVHYTARPPDAGSPEAPAYELLLGGETHLIAPESQDLALAANLLDLGPGSTHEPWLALNVHSAGFIAEGNLVACDRIEASLAEARATAAEGGYVIACAWAGPPE